MADRYCRKEKAKKLGYSIHDEAFYSPALVEQLLPFAFNNNIETKDLNMAVKQMSKELGGDNPWV
jgi:hypothetical protein